MAQWKKIVLPDDGTMMIMALLVFLCISIMSLSLVSTGLMEYKSSHFENMTLQAQQGADGAVEWGSELIDLELDQEDCRSLDELPAQLSSGNRTMMLGDDGCSIMVGDIIKINEISGEPGYCTYEFIACGLYKGARKEIKVQVMYHFSGGYETVDGEGSLAFIPREYLDHGQVVSYQPYFR